MFLRYIEDMGYESGALADCDYAFGVLAEMEVRQNIQFPLESRIYGQHPKLGYCMVVVNVFGDCLLLWNRRSNVWHRQSDPLIPPKLRFILNPTQPPDQAQAA